MNQIVNARHAVLKTISECNKVLSKAQRYEIHGNTLVKVVAPEFATQLKNAVARFITVRREAVVNRARRYGEPRSFVFTNGRQPSQVKR